MAIRLKFSIFLMICIFVISCSEAPPAAPACRVNENYFNPINVGGACIVKLNQKLMVITNSKGLYDLPKSNKISDTSGQCAAHSAMWDDTGFNVEVGMRLGQINQDLWLYSCESNTGFDGSEQISPPEWANNDVVMISFINPFEYSLHDWAEPDEFVHVLDAFVAQDKMKNLVRPIDIEQD